MAKEPPIIHPPTQLSGGCEQRYSGGMSDVVIGVTVLAVGLFVIFFVKVEIRWPW